MSISIGGRFGETHRTTGLTAVIGGLQPSTNYSFHIIPINAAGEGSQQLNVFCKTSEDGMKTLCFLNISLLTF